MSEVSHASLVFIVRRVALGLVGAFALIAAPNLAVPGGASSSISAIAGALLLTVGPLYVVATVRSLQSRRRAETIHQEIGPATVLDAHVDALLLEGLSRAWPDLGRLRPNEAIGRVLNLAFGAEEMSLWGGEPAREVARAARESLLYVGGALSELNGRPDDALKVTVRVDDELRTLLFVVSESGSSGLWKLSRDRIEKVAAAISDEAPRS